MAGARLDRTLVSVSFILILVLAGFDIRQDQVVGGSWRHMIIDGLVALLALAGLFVLWKPGFSTKTVASDSNQDS